MEVSGQLHAPAVSPPGKETPVYILILSSYLSLVRPSGLFPSGFPTKMLFSLIFSPISLSAIL
jgi:hypothetical protein